MNLLTRYWSAVRFVWATYLTKRWIRLVAIVASIFFVLGGMYALPTPFHPGTIVRTAYQWVYPPAPPPAVHITFVEGETISQMAEQVSNAFPNISAEAFTTAAEQYDGYLFPDTYFFAPDADTATILAKMHSNFDIKITPLLPDISAAGHSLADIVTMASLIEGEASSTVDRGMVSGILWNRLAKNMPLQVDVARETYTHRGLPAEPINNPSLDSLTAAVHLTSTKYLYYLTGKDGIMHYATTYAGHQANLKKYLE